MSIDDVSAAEAGEAAEEAIDPRFLCGGESYNWFPTRESDLETEDYALDDRRWREGDRRVKRIMLPGDPDAPPMRFTGHATNGRKREKKRIGGGKDVKVGGEGRGTNTLRLPGFTRGVREFYHRRSGLAIRLVVAYDAAFLQTSFTLEPLPRTRSKKRLLNFEVYGLTDEQYERLNPIRRHVARDLFAHAVQNGAALIRRYDGEPLQDKEK